MEDMEYLLDRIAFLEDRLAHLESMLMPKENPTQTNLNYISIFKTKRKKPQQKYTMVECFRASLIFVEIYNEQGSVKD